MGKKIKGFLALIIFLVILIFPIIYNQVTGKTVNPKLELEKAATSEKKCKVGHFIGDMTKEEDRNYIIKNHGDIISHAGILPGVKKSVRDQAVRQGKANVNGLQGCIECHQTRTKFCEKCHTYAGVQKANNHTGCFACHFYPKDINEWERWDKHQKKRKAELEARK